MTLVLVDRYLDARDQLVHRYHAPSSTTPGKVYVVDNLVGTDVWSCGPLSGKKEDLCEASRYKKPCRHIPNWREPRKGVASKTTTEGGSPYSPGQFDEATAEQVMTLREKIAKYGDENITYRNQIVKRMSGPIAIGYLAHYHGLRIIVPEEFPSSEAYLMSLPQFSTLRTASLDVLKEKQEAKQDGWMDDGTRQERHEAYRRLYAAEGQGKPQMVFRVGA